MSVPPQKIHYVLQMNIPIKDTEQRTVSAMQNFSSGQKGGSLHRGKISTKGGKQSIPPSMPDAKAS
jgi:hypothetical protein